MATFNSNQPIKLIIPPPKPVLLVIQPPITKPLLKLVVPSTASGQLVIRSAKDDYLASLLASFSPEIQAAVRNRTVSKAELLQLKFTEMLRLAAVDKEVEKLVQAEYGYQGLAIRAEYALLDHQIETMHWMRQREGLNHHGMRGGIIHWEMGLGKTLLALAYTLATPKTERTFPTLIVSSKTMLREWKREGIEKFFGPSVRALYLHRDLYNGNIDQVKRQMIRQYDLVLTTYDVCRMAAKKGNYINDVCEYGASNTLRNGRVIAVHERLLRQADLPTVTGTEVIYGTPWERIIADETQVFANPKTLLYKTMMAIYGHYKWCLSGTPVRNYNTDIWAQFRWLGYKTITKARDWKVNSQLLFGTQQLDQVIYSLDYQGAGIILPDKIEQIIHLELTDNELECYEHILHVAQEAYDLLMSDLIGYACMLVIFTRLRQCCIAPFLMTPISKRKKTTALKTDNQRERVLLAMVEELKGSLGSWVYDKKNRAGIRSTKLTAIVDKLLSIPVGEKVLVFSSFTSCLDLLEDAIKDRDPNYALIMIDGDVSGKERERKMSIYRNDPGVRALLMPYKVGAEGINLETANHVILTEPWWTPAVHRQAISRCWRRGQDRQVTVYTFRIAGSIEDRIMSVCQEKEELAAHYLKGSQHRVNAGINKVTMGRILGFRP